MPVDGTGTASVEAVKAPLVPGVQKPPSRVGKQFQDRLVAAPAKKKVKKPVGLKTRPLGCGKTTWARTRRPAAASQAASRGDRCRAGLKAADGDHLIPRPHLEGEGGGGGQRHRTA
jgi:hypothetical protein